MIGQRLGPYEVTAKLGEGGMGEVYRAIDSRLKREVAIKVLPAAFTDDKQRLARFEREAQILAQLQHPNVAAIFGLEEAGGVRGLVMELVEGPTLAERLEQGALPVEECLTVARQIAEALEAAHEKGIVHRDLKPQNVKAAMGGAVKVLDFGLAKAMDAAAASSTTDLARSPTMLNSPTLTGAPGTQLGVILGTAAYMAPEQAAGWAADRRADIWSFGVVLYEMLAGRRLFDGETVSHVLAGVLKDEPDFSALPPATPPKVRDLLRRCLRKKPRERLQSIGDARLVLEEVIAGNAGDEGAATPVATQRRAPWWTTVAAGVLLLAAGLAAGRWLLAPQPQPPAVLRLELAVPEGLSLEWGDGQSSIALSPDGRRLALAVVGEEGRSGLLLRDLDQHEPRLLAGTEGARAPFFSPEGGWVGYATADALYKIAVSGGNPIRLATVTRRSRGAAWGKDGYIYFSADSDVGITRIAESGGPVEAVTTLDTKREERTHRWPELTAGGEALVISVDTTESPNFLDDARIEAVRLSTGERHLLVDGASQARLLASDILVYAQGGHIFAVEIDVRRLVPRGKAVPLEQEVTGNLGTGASQVAVSKVGSAAWIPGAASRGGEAPVWLTLDGKASPSSIPETLPIHQIDLSPDGRRAAIAAGGPLGSQVSVGRDIWIADLERQTVARLSINENADSPTWMPDGRRIAYRRIPRAAGVAEAASEQIVCRPADGSGEVQVLYEETGVRLGTSSFSPDGRHAALTRTQGGNTDIWLLPFDPAGPATPFQTSPFVEGGGVISPNGRWIAYVSRESGDEEVYVRPFPDGPGRWQLSSTSGLEPRWSADGTSLFFRAAGGRLMRVAIEAGAVFRASAPEQILTGFTSGPNPRTYGVAPDGQRFLALPFARVRTLHAVNYGDDWLARARLLLTRND